MVRLIVYHNEGKLPRMNWMKILTIISNLNFTPSLLNLCYPPVYCCMSISAKGNILMMILFWDGIWKLWSDLQDSVMRNIRNCGRNLGIFLCGMVICLNIARSGDTSSTCGWFEGSKASNHSRTT